MTFAFPTIPSGIRGGSSPLPDPRSPPLKAAASLALISTGFSGIMSMSQGLTLGSGLSVVDGLVRYEPVRIIVIAQRGPVRVSLLGRYTEARPE